MSGDQRQRNDVRQAFDGQTSDDGAHLNQQSTNNEALLYQGGYDPTVATQVAASAGVTGDASQTQQAASDFARMASEAIRNGLPLDKVRFNDPTLTEEAKAAIYAQVAQQQGTSPEEIERKAQEQAEADMRAVQGAVFGMAGAAVAQDLPPSVTLGQLLEMSGGNLTAPATPFGAMPEREAGMIFGR